MKNLFTPILLLMSSLAIAQFSVEEHNGDPLVDGQTVSYGIYGYGGAELDFYVNNLSTADQMMTALV